ncbi:MAG: hypothetical protein JW940_12130 [Polyangiaceae bacterium]|nr:hypothetical protein [Polyangiaceae bacterium]
MQETNAMYQAANRRPNRRLNVLGVVTVIAAAAGCGSGDQVKQKESGNPAGERFSDYRVTVFAGENMERFDVRPSDTTAAKDADEARVEKDLSAGKTAKRKTGSSASGPGGKGLVVIGRVESDAGLEPDTPVADDVNLALDSTREALVWGAAYECGMGCSYDCFDGDDDYGYASDDNRTYAPQMQLKPVVDDEDPNPFDRIPEDCELKLQQQEMLACMAGKLVEVAEAVGPVIWSRVPMSVPWGQPPGIPRGPWVIAPLRDKERFIVREQAVRLLQEFAWLEGLQQFNSPPGYRPWAIEDFTALGTETCDQAYYKAYSTDATKWATVSRALVGVSAGRYPPFDGQYVSAAYGDKDDLIDARVERRVKSLKAVGELLRGHLIEKSVYSDLAGAYQQRAAATHPARGLALMWGTASGAQYSGQDLEHNNLRHAARWFFGRWFRSLDEDQTATNALFDAAPLFTGTRDLDFPASTPGEDRAAALLLASGIVVSESLDYPDNPNLTRAKLRDQLLEQEAHERGIGIGSTEYDQFVDAAAVGKAFDELSDQEIAYGLKKTRLVFSQLTGLELPTQTDSKAAWTHWARYGFTQGYRSDAMAADEVAAIVWQGGVPAQVLAGDVMARAFAMQENQIGGTFWPDAVPGYPSEAQHSVFHLGAVLQANLGALRVPGWWSELEHERERTLAQYDSWVSGQLRVRLSTSADEVIVRAVGLYPDEMGWSEPSVVNPAIVAVVGEYWAADCVAGLRPASLCPPDLWDTSVVLPNSWTVLGDDDTLLANGSRVDEIRFPYSTSAIADAYDTGAEYVPNLYLVSVGSSTSSSTTSSIPSSTGQVLAQVFPTDYYRIYVVSKHQRELANAALGVTSEAGAQGVGAPTTGDPKNYCIPGVSADEFVPLENELTEDSDAYEDSWNYYLNLAQNAADRAQTIADQIFDLELQRDMKFEGAQEEYAETCGDFADLDPLIWGVDGIPRDNGGAFTENRCLNEDRYDVTFLANVDSSTLASWAAQAGYGSDVDAFLKKNVLHCATNASDQVVDTRPACQPGAAVQWTHLDTDVSAIYTPDADSIDISECQVVAQARASLLDHFKSDDVVNAGQLTWRDEPNLLAAIDSFELSQDDYGEWTVEFSGETVMDSHSNQPLWPGCMWASSGSDYYCDVAADAHPTIEFLNSLFGTPNEAGDETHDKLPLLWRVEGALWYLASMAGHAHPGLMQIQYPVANFANSQEPSQPLVAPYPTVFGSSYFDYDSGSGLYALQTTSADDPAGVILPDDQQRLGFARGMVSGPFGGSHYEDAGAPIWLYDPYGPYAISPAGNTSPERFLHVWASTPEIPFPPKAESTVLPPVWPLGDHSWKALDKYDKDNKAFLSTPNNVDLFLRTKMSKLRGTQCEAGFVGGGSGDPVAIAQNEGRDLWGRGFVLCPGAMFDRVPLLDFIADDGWAAQGGNIAFRDRLMTKKKATFGVNSFLAIPVTKFPFGTYSISELLSGQGGANPGNLRAYQAANYRDADWGGKAVSAFTRTQTRPLACDQHQRAPLMTNIYVPKTPCEGMDRILGALGLACLANRNGFGITDVLDHFEPITSERDIPRLQRWVRRVSDQLGMIAGRLVAEDVPKRALVTAENAGDADFRGSQGTLVSGMTDDLANIAKGWRDAATAIAQIYSDLDGLRLGIAGIHLNRDIEQHRMAIERLDVMNRMIQVQRDMVESFDPLTLLVGSFYEIGQMLIDGFLASAQLDNYQQQILEFNTLDTLKEQQAQNDISLAFNEFQGNLIARVSAVRDALDLVQRSVISVTEKKDQFGFGQDMARYYAAQASGQPFVTIGGEVVPLLVNQAINSRLDVLKRRKAMVETEARYLAYLTRRAIEQRIAMRLKDIDTPIGNWAAPSTWADDICSLDPADYSNADFKLEFDDEATQASFQPTDETLEQLKNNVLESIREGRGELLSIADYVNRLANFVAFYTMSYPFKDAEDVTILSMREDLLPTSTEWCTVVSTNLLVNSGALDDVRTGDNGSGWRTSECQDSICLMAIKAPATLELPEDSTSGSATLLRETSVVEEDLDAGIPGWVEAGTDSPDAAELTGDAVQPAVAIPARSVYQSLALNPGAYLLSWWDQAVEGATSGEYRVSILDPDGNPIAGYTASPNPAVDGWSSRNVFSFVVDETGVYSVVFGAAAAGADESSVYIANVQLEGATSVKADVTAYQDTGVSRAQMSHECKSAEVFRRQFEHKCANGRCFYELVTPFTIDTELIANGTSALSSKFASGNFNFRHIDTAVNIVGTGVLDCSNSGELSCYGTGLVEYSLEHLAYNAKLVNHNGQMTPFDFGMGAIRNARALATERYITLPIGNSDNDLLRQPQITKTELSGRPLGGVYRFRVYEEPTLVWNKVEDIQFVLHHRYWSRVSKNPMPNP